MTDTLHKDITGADLHEPKGVASATSGQVYAADGAGSGTWTTLSIPTGIFTISYSDFTSSGTWTKPAKLLQVKVIVIGSGGTESATGGNVSFGSHFSATGGAATGAPGAGSSGDLNFTGQSYAGARGGKSAYCLGTYGDGADGAVNSGSGGGASIKIIQAASLGTTETVTIGTSGNNNGYVLVEQYIET